MTVITTITATTATTHDGHIRLMSSVFCEYKNCMHTFRLGREERRGRRERER